jgi:hypothetical protein
MRTRNLKQAGLVGIGALLLLGAALGDPSDDLGGPTAEGASTGKGDFDEVEIVDAALKPMVQVTRVGSQLGENNLLGVFAGIKNKTTHPLALEIETIYKDKGGNVLTTGSWIRFSIKAGAQGDYRSVSISEGATDFLIRVRRARSSHAPAH